jgi:hypothetical protein
MIWTPTIEHLRVPIRRTTERALKRLDKDPPRDVLLRLAHDVWTTASRATRERAAKAKETPREAELRRHLTALTSAVRVFVERLDTIMVQPATNARGRAIGELVNTLRDRNDMARIFGLKIPLKKLDDEPAGDPLSEEVIAFVRGIVADDGCNSAVHGSRENAAKTCTCDFLYKSA